MKNLFITFIMTSLSVIVYAQASGVQVQINANASGNGTCDAKITGTVSLKTNNGCTPSTNFCNTCQVPNSIAPAPYVILSLQKKLTQFGTTWWQAVSNSQLPVSSNVSPINVSISSIGEYRLEVVYTNGGSIYNSCMAVSGSNQAVGYSPSFTFTQILKPISLSDIDFRVHGKNASSSYPNINHPHDPRYAKWITGSICNSTIPFSIITHPNNNSNNGAEYKLFWQTCDNAGIPTSSPQGITTFTPGLPTITSLTQLNIPANQVSLYKISYLVRNSCMPSGQAHERNAYFSLTSGAAHALTLLNNTVNSDICSTPSLVCKNSPTLINMYPHENNEIKVYSHNGNCNTTLLSTRIFNNQAPNNTDIRSWLPGGISNTSTGNYLFEITQSTCPGNVRQQKAYFEVVSSCKTDGEDVTTSVDDLNEKETFSNDFYPNPAKDFIVVSKDVRYRFFNLQNKEFKLNTESIDDNSNRIITADLAKGIYFIKFEHNPAVKKLIIE